MNNIDEIFEEYKGYVFSFEFDGNIKLLKCYFKPECEIRQECIIVKKKDNLYIMVLSSNNLKFRSSLLIFLFLYVVNITLI
jgi:hypothetical protein